MYLEIKNLNKIFEQRKGVQNINLQVKEGELVTLLGPSGCGKTTLLNLIGGFLSPDSGVILIEAKDIVRLNPEDRPISTVFQNYALFPHMNVIENIGYGLKYTSLKKKEQLDEAKRYLKIVGLEGYEKIAIQNLSGGQQQRVALARALVLKPKILLLDEPFSNLDVKLKINMREELKYLQKKLKITMIFVTHDQEEALSISDKIVVMKDGEIIQVGSPEDIYYSPANDYVADFIGKINIFYKDNKKVLIRPEEIKMILSKEGDWIIESKEFLGSSSLFYLKNKTNSKTLISQVFERKSSEFLVGDSVKIQIF
ncbi:ABC transporter ATP-binding protein (plasmid) [Cetobacterium somerae]|uniref:ABC transporter ATP-binding protein n=1 Tax=Cetobacterium somerae TaxID=188913 RepID=UPI002E7C035D|nr:ABC transporter ATP-binding protein [Cetobacterium somerae]WVJ02943.1 ABC transporter ATP-binding protein [Cetobacterium somerae]